MSLEGFKIGIVLVKEAEGAAAIEVLDVAEAAEEKVGVLPLQRVKG